MATLALVVIVVLPRPRHHRVGVDQAGVDAQAFELPDPGVGRHLDAGAGRFDDAVADHHRAVVDDLPGRGHDADPGQGVDLRRLGGRRGARAGGGQGERRAEDASPHVWLHGLAEASRPRPSARSARR